MCVALVAPFQSCFYVPSFMCCMSGCPLAALSHSTNKAGPADPRSDSFCVAAYQWIVEQQLRCIYEQAF